MRPHHLTFMNKIKTSCQALLDVGQRALREDRNERGATLVEYGMMLVLVLIVAFLSLKTFGDTIVALFETTNSVIEDAPGMQDAPAAE